MKQNIICYGCGKPTRRGFPMITQDGEEVIICEKCHRFWKKHQTEEKGKAEVE